MSVHTSVDVQSGSTSEELAARAVALQPLLRKHAGYGDLHRRQPDEVITALAEAGLFGLLVPRRFGGQQASLRTLLNVTEALAEVDGSAAWVVSLGAVAGWLVGLASERAREDVFGEDPDARIAGSITPTPAERVDGGLLVTGRWPYVSGSPHATWAAVGALVPDDAGSPEALLCLIPMEQLTVEDTWHTVGMRGTGSHHLAAEDVFVPAYRTIRLSDIADGGSAECAGEVDDRPHTGSVLSLSILSPCWALAGPRWRWPPTRPTPSHCTTPSTTGRRTRSACRFSSPGPPSRCRPPSCTPSTSSTSSTPRRPAEFGPITLRGHGSGRSADTP